MNFNVDYFGFVYLWRDSYRKMSYIGSHMGSTADSYKGSSTRFKRAITKRPSDFRRKILWILTTNDRKRLLQEEERWLQMIPSQQLQRKYYNVKRRGTGGFVTEGYSKEQRDAYIEKLKQRPSKGAKQWKARACFCIDKQYTTLIEAKNSIGFDPSRRLHGRKYENFYWVDEGPISKNELELATLQTKMNKQKSIEAMKLKNLTLSKEYHQARTKKSGQSRKGKHWICPISSRIGRKVSIDSVIYNNLKHASSVVGLKPWQIRVKARNPSIQNIFFVDD